MRVFRPMGLTDVPGGASSAGFYSVLLGIGFFLTSKSRVLTAATIASMMGGMMCLYLSQVRALMVTTLVCVVVVTFVLIARGEGRKLGSFGIVLAMLVVLSFKSALSLAHSSVADRVGSLTAGRPSDIYARNRGHFLTHTFVDLVPQYPFGAGLGRWGMMNAYFGENGDPTHGGLWAEIQWTGWVYDGGIPLMLAYFVALLLALLTAWRIARLPDPPGYEGLSLWAIVLLGYGIGAIALTFSYPIFISQTGMEFWLMTTLLFAVAARARPALFFPQRSF
jgi:hypothetical protein